MTTVQANNRTQLSSFSVHLTYCLTESSACAYLEFGFAIPIHISEQLKPQPAELIQLPIRMRILLQKPILVIHQTIQHPKLTLAQTRPNKLLANPNILPNQPYAPPRFYFNRLAETCFGTTIVPIVQRRMLLRCHLTLCPD